MIVKEVVSSGHLSSHLQMYFLSSYVMNCMFSVTLSFFFKFHLGLVWNNSTTIETLDKKNAKKKGFSQGVQKNLMQTFGKNPWLWLLPMTGASGKPIGDGVTWTSAIQDLEEVAEENSNKINQFPDRISTKEIEDLPNMDPLTSPGSHHRYE